MLIKETWMNLRNILLSASVCMCSLGANATTEAQEKIEVLNVIKKFTESVSCETQPISLKDIYMVERDIKYGSSTYYVLWGGDIGCNGGNTNYSRYVTEVNKFRRNTTFTIDIVEKDGTLRGLYAFDDTIVHDFIENIKRINSNKFEVISWDYASDKWGGKEGGRNFPANKFKYTLERVGYGHWEVSSQVLLEQKK